MRSTNPCIQQVGSHSASVDTIFFQSWDMSKSLCQCGGRRLRKGRSTRGCSLFMGTAASSPKLLWSSMLSLSESEETLPSEDWRSSLDAEYCGNQPISNSESVSEPSSLGITPSATFLHFEDVIGNICVRGTTYCREESWLPTNFWRDAWSFCSPETMYIGLGLNLSPSDFIYTSSPIETLLLEADLAP